MGSTATLPLDDVAPVVSAEAVVAEAMATETDMVEAVVAAMEEEDLTILEET